MTNSRETAQSHEHTVSTLGAWANNVQELPLEVAEQNARERLTRGALVGLHRWWARRTAVLARVATYLALTEQQELDEAFPASLSMDSMPSAVLQQVAAQVRDAQWRWAWREARHGEDTEAALSADPPELGAPRVLDPFAGGGVFASEAARLGCEATASDLNPLAFHLLRAGLQYPTAYRWPDLGVPGTALSGTWAGLSDELEHWANRMSALAAEHLTNLFPAPLEPPDDQPGTYLWFQTTRCSNRSCDRVFPVQPCVRVGRASTKPRRLCLIESSDTFEARLEDGEVTMRGRGAVCPFCETVTNPAGLTVDTSHIEDSLLAAVNLMEGRPARLLLVASSERHFLAPWSAASAQRLAELLEQDFGHLLRRQLPTGTYAHLRRHGLEVFSDLFSPRQRLVALEYTEAINRVRDEMRALGIPIERTTAIVTYLAFFLGHLIDRNSRLCTWRGDVGGSTFDRMTAAFPWVWVERNPQGLLAPWLAQVRSVIKLQGSLPAAAEVQLADATRMPWADESFDAIVTDPPYFDSVPYDDLAEFYWAWEGSILEHGRPPAAQRIAVAPGEDDELARYQGELLCAFRESFRVLKPGRVFAMILTVKIQQRFDEYVSIAQEAGFELTDVRSLSEELGRSKLVATHAVSTFLISFRKPFFRHVRPQVELGGAEQGLLTAAANGRPILYAGLAQVLKDELGEEDLVGLIPPGARGTLIEQLMEVFAFEDPRALLERSLGLAGLRRVAQRMELLDGLGGGTSPLDVILGHFGLTLPAPSTTKASSKSCGRSATPRYRYRLPLSRRRFAARFSTPRRPSSASCACPFGGGPTSCSVPSAMRCYGTS